LNLRNTPKGEAMKKQVVLSAMVAVLSGAVTLATWTSITPYRPLDPK
jgi:flagellar biosynthesis/type III secretory pathway M-ring protein FliF/YscJ